MFTKYKPLVETLEDMSCELEMLFNTTPSNGLEAIQVKDLRDSIVKLTRNSRKVLDFILKTTDLKIPEITKSQLVLRHNAVKSKFLTNSNIIVFKPSGFTGQFIDLTELLLLKSKTMQEYHLALDVAALQFSNYINNPDELVKVTSNNFNNLSDINDFAKDLSPMFQGTDGVDRDTLSNIYNSWKEYGLVTDNITKLLETHKTVDIKEIEVKADKLYDVLDLLDKVITEGKIQLSPSSAKAIGNHIFKISNGLGYYSLYITKLISLSNAHLDNTKKINKAY